MLEIEVKGIELYDEKEAQFITTKDTTLQLEHSLISLAKWESKWHKPFIDNKNLTVEETIDYIRCMTISRNIDPNVYLALSQDNVLQIKSYMDDTMTASWFNDNQKVPKSHQKAVTAELIYYWMISLQIPFECEKWHLNRLLTLIRVCNIENSPKKKMRKGDIYKQNRALNEARRKSLHTNG